MPIPTMPEQVVSKQDSISTASEDEDSTSTQTQVSKVVEVAPELAAEIPQEKQEIALNQELPETAEQEQLISKESPEKQVLQQSIESQSLPVNEPRQVTNNQSKETPSNITTEEKADVIEDVLSTPVISNVGKQKILSKPATLASHQNDASLRPGKELAIPTKVKTLPETAKNTVPKFALLTADDRVRNAISFFNHGEVEKAEKELEDALVIEPNNRSARKLMRQLHQLPGDFFPQDEFFEYVLGPDETLIDVSAKFLNDPLAFYMLAKLNDIKDPISVVPGKVLKVPGNAEDFGDLIKSPESQRKDSLKKNENLIKFERAKVYVEEHRFKEAIDLLSQFSGNSQFEHQQEANDLLALSYVERAKVLDKKGETLKARTLLETAASRLPHNNKLLGQLKTVKNKQEAERLYLVGLELNKMGNSHQALKTFAKVLDLNPAHSEAKKLIVDLKLTVVETSHKRAMVLYRRQELSQAIEIWNDILEIDPQHELAKQYRAKALELKRKIERL